MHPRRSLAAAAVPAALSLALAVPALASSSVTVRVEGASRTLLPATAVTAPSSGSITTGGAPAGTCPSGTAAGALDGATHHHWNGTYSSGLGIDVTSILGTTLSYAKGSYWGFYVNDRYASTGICDTKLHGGEQLLFAAIPAKGKTPLPLVEKAPRRVTAGKAFDVRTFVYAGKRTATRSVSSVTPTVLEGGRSKVGKISVGRSPTRGTIRLTLDTPGRATLSVSHKGFIRSVATQISVVR